MDVTVRKADINETEELLEFFHRLIDNQHKLPYDLKWERNVHPSDGYIADAVKSGEMYAAVVNGRIAGAMVLNCCPCDGYEKADWTVKSDDKDIMIVHALGVDYELMHRGIGRRMAEHAIRLAGERGFSAIHLDVIDGNIYAAALYESVGFNFVETVTMYYDCTGFMKFHLYEYNL